MSTPSPFLPSLLLAVGLAMPLPAQDAATAELSRVAEAYVAAYNEKNLDAIVALYTPEASMIDEIDSLSASGTDEIRSIFERSFANYPDRQIALDVLSVRQVAENAVVEEGLARFSGEVPNEEGDTVAYSALIVKDPSKGWLIAESRELSAGPADEDPLAQLLPLVGDWVLQAEQMQMTLFFDLSPSGRFLTGLAATTTPAEGTMETEIRIGYDADAGQIVWWTFDELGGFAQGGWQPTEEGWLVRTSGVTADGERSHAIQELRFDGDDTIEWNSTHRFLDGEALPDASLRLVRQPPAPELSFDETAPTDGSASTSEAEESSPAPPKP